MKIFERKYLLSLMYGGLKKIAEGIQTKYRRPSPVTSSKAQIHPKFHKIPTINFDFGMQACYIPQLFRDEW
jgi:hypothetical protein